MCVSVSHTVRRGTSMNVGKQKWMFEERLKKHFVCVLVEIEGVFRQLHHSTNNNLWEGKERDSNAGNMAWRGG